MDSQHLAVTLNLQDRAIGVREVKSRFSALAAGLSEAPKEPVVIKSDGRLIAVLLNIHEYQRLLARAEEYDRMQQEVELAV